MRALSAAQAAVRASGHQADHVRVQVKDAGGTWRDLTTYPGFNAVTSFRVTDDVGSPHLTADVDVQRESFKRSLSPYMAASPLNRGFDPAASPVALLAIGREFKIEVAVTPMDRQPSAGDWMELFSGRIDNVDPAAGASVRFGGRDKAGRIADQQIKKERVYGFASDGGMAVSLRPWEAGMVVALNEYVLPASRGTSDPGLNKFLKCSQAGTTGNSEPVWTTGTNQVDGTARWNYVGAPTTLGRPVEQVMQNLLDDNKASGDAAVTLYVPVSPSWAIKEFVQSRDRNLAAIRALAQQIGWDVRMKWRAGTSQFELTLYEPERSKATVDATFQPSEYGEPSQLETSIEAIRNSWQLVYSDPADPWPDGSAKRKVASAADAASITKYGELWAEIAEPSGGNIDSATEANKMVQGALSDCAEPTADFAVPLMQGFPWVELGDRFTFGADGRRFDSAQTFAVTKWSHRFEKGKLRTELSMRGKPALAAWQWIAVSTLAPFSVGELRPPPQLSHFSGKKTVTVRPVKLVGGVGLELGDDTDRRRGQREYEIHLSETPSFAVSESTLKGVVADKVASVPGLRPGATYYGKAVPRSYSKGKLSRGQPAAEFSFGVSRVTAALLDPLATVGGLPNGDFQGIWDTGETPANPPDHWTVVAGSWGSSSEVWRGIDSERGRTLLLRQTATQGIAENAVHRLPLGALALRLSAWVRPSGTLVAGRGLQFNIAFFSDPDGLNTLSDHDVICPYNHVAADTWGFFHEDITPPDGAQYARVRVLKESTSNTFGWALASVDLLSVAPQIEVWTAPSFATNWGNVGGGWMTVGFLKAPDGFVRLRGGALVNTATLTATIFTLPVGYRPTATLQYPVRMGTNVLSYVNINSSGQVQYAGAGGGVLADAQSGLFLDHVKFDTR